MTDRFSKQTKVIYLRTTETYDCAVAFVEQWVYKYGAPACLLSDNWSQFNARFFEATWQLLGVTSDATAALHPKRIGKPSATIAPYSQCSEITSEIT